MDSKILINYATRGRAELFKKAIQNIYDTIESQNYIILVKVDNDDDSMKWLQQAMYKNMIVYQANHKNKVDAINSGIGLISDWDILVNMSDDMVFIEKGWDNVIRENIKDGFFLHLPDGYVNERLTTMSILHKDYFDLDGYVYHPEYKTESCDAEAMYVAQMRERYIYSNKRVYSHIHPCNVGGSSDSTYNRNGVFANADHQLYFQRMKRKFDLKENEIKMIPDVVQQYQ